MEARSSAALGTDFPYTLQTLCYIEIAKDGTVSHGTDAGTYERARSGKSQLFAVWPGEWASHLFVIHDLDEYARAHGLIHDQERTGLADHDHTARWELDSSENKPMGSYITIRVAVPGVVGDPYTRAFPAGDVTFSFATCMRCSPSPPLLLLPRTCLPEYPDGVHG